MALLDEKTLKRLSVDKEPNVAIAAMLTPQDAIRGLTSNHSGLVLAAAERLKNAPELAGALPALFASLERLSKLKRATVRDPRLALLARIGEVVDARSVARLRPLMTDLDPVVAIAAANIVALQTGEAIKPRATGYVFPKLASEATLRGLDSATARLTIKDVGAFTIELLPDDAPGTVATFVSLATAARYNGLTFHRIVPNFIIQGGSPGANEYDAITRDFMPDELGLTSNLRGTLGISTRGRDTGDGQIFVNLIDNFRLDHEYTVFARVIEGMDVVDRVQEGDVITSVQIRRKKPPSAPRPRRP
jgi:cyclophilin family peptidyl-prolyl cis-trans isomerase